MGARHDRTHEEAPQVLGSSREGLTTAEATARRGRHDLNQLQERPSRNPRLVFLNQSAETMVAVLLVTAALSLPLARTSAQLIPQSSRAGELGMV